MHNPFREGEIVRLDNRVGLYRVELPLAGITWVRGACMRGNTVFLGKIDGFVDTCRLSRANVVPPYEVVA